jgi:DNA-binding transcriptional LysR family regulator
MDRIASNQLFIRVVEAGSFSKAAEQLGITQPTATKAVASLEARLGARLLNRNTRGISPTDIGQLYYEKCKAIQREIDEADNLPALLQQRVAGRLRLSTSVAFGRRVLTPLLLRFMAEHPEISIDLNAEDRYVDLISQGIDVAVRMGRLADSSLGARFLGSNPWVMVASKGYLGRARPLRRARELGTHECLVYSSVQGDDVWQLTDATGKTHEVRVHSRLRSNNLSALLAAARSGYGVAILPRYVAHESLRKGDVVEVLPEYSLPTQEMHAVYPSPKLVSQRVLTFIDFLATALKGPWWTGQFAHAGEEGG